MKYIIMADGKGTRWNNYNNIPKHLVEINGEILLQKTIRQIHENDKNCFVIVTSHDPRYEFEGATRYEPLNNVLEIDRFTEELIEDNICFLYGDTNYSDKSLKTIIETNVDDLMFFGNNKSIVAIKIKDSKVFEKHLKNVKSLFLEGKIQNCKGWQVYQSFQKLEFDKKVIANNFIIVDDAIDYNTPDEYESFKKIKGDDII